MSRRNTVLLGVAIALTTAGLGTGQPAAAAPPTHGARPPFAGSAAPVCPGPASIGSARCHAWVLHPAKGHGPQPPPPVTTPGGLSPTTIKSVYGFPTSSTAGAGMTIAIVDAYDDPTVENDLGVFSSQFGLPPARHPTAASPR